MFSLRLVGRPGFYTIDARSDAGAKPTSRAPHGLTLPKAE